MRALPLCVWFNPSAGFRQIILSLALFSLVASGAQAASYVQIDGTVVDPIQSRLGGDLAYAGPNLEPKAYLQSADLSGANLTDADLREADLSDADLRDANLIGATMTATDLTGAIFCNTTMADGSINNADCD